MPETSTNYQQIVEQHKKAAFDHEAELRDESVEDEVQEEVAKLEKSKNWSLSALSPVNILKRIRERKQFEAKKHNIREQEITSAIAEKEVQGPPFAKEMSAQIAEQQELIAKMDAAEAEVLKREKIALTTEDISTSSPDDLDRLEEILERRTQLTNQQITAESVEEAKTDFLKLKIDHHKKVKAGEIISTEAADTHNLWEKNEKIATALQERVRSFLQENRDVILAEEDDLDSIADRYVLLNKIQEEVDAAIDRSMDSRELLRSLAEQVGKQKPTAEGVSLTDQIKDYITAETRQLFGVEIEYTPEEELFSSETVQQAFEEVLKDLHLVTDLDGEPIDTSPYISKLQKQLGVRVTEMFDSETEQKIVEYSLTEDSSLRAELLSGDSVRALREAVERNLEEAENDPDYAIAAAQRAADLINSQANAARLEADRAILTQDIEQEQVAAILAKRNEIAKSNALLEKVRENREKRKETIDQVKQKFTKFINWGARKLRNLVSPEAKMAEDEILYKVQVAELEKYDKALARYANNYPTKESNE